MVEITSKKPTFKLILATLPYGSPCVHSYDACYCEHTQLKVKKTGAGRPDQEVFKYVWNLSPKMCQLKWCKLEESTVGIEFKEKVRMGKPKDIHEGFNESTTEQFKCYGLWSNGEVFKQEIKSHSLESLLLPKWHISYSFSHWEVSSWSWKGLEQSCPLTSSLTLLLVLTCEWSVLELVLGLGPKLGLKVKTKNLHLSTRTGHR